MSALEDSVARVRAEIAASESARGRFDHGPQAVTSAAARARETVDQNAQVLGRLLEQTAPLAPATTGTPALTTTELAQRTLGRAALRFLLIPAIIGVGVGVWQRSWRAGAVSGGVSLGITAAIAVATGDITVSARST